MRNDIANDFKKGNSWTSVGNVGRIEEISL